MNENATDKPDETTNSDVDNVWLKAVLMPMSAIIMIVYSLIGILLFRQFRLLQFPMSRDAPEQEEQLLINEPSMKYESHEG